MSWGAVDEGGGVWEPRVWSADSALLSLTHLALSHLLFPPESCFPPAFQPLEFCK